MSRITKTPLPDNALLRRYVDAGSYTDCYSTLVSGQVAFAEFVIAFYTTWLFKLERFILKWLVKKPSTDEDAARVARGDQDEFAAWDVESRDQNQLLLTDFQGRTRSWFMTEAAGGHTRLYFGSAVVLLNADESVKQARGRSYRLLLGFHKLYSRALLSCAASRLRRQHRK